MVIGNWLLVSVVFWLIGYIASKATVFGFDRLIIVPKWLFILLGCPKQKIVPSGVVSVRSFIMQFTAIMMALYGLLPYYFVSDSTVNVLIGFLMPMILCAAVAQWIYKRFPYFYEKDHPKSE